MLRPTSRALGGLTLASMNPAVVQAQYAVRGPIVARADAIVADLAKGGSNCDKYDFDSVIMCNIGNPQALKQPPLTFYREVLSLLVNPQALEKRTEHLEAIYNKESIDRAREYVAKIGFWTTTGAYTASKGYPWVRKILAEWMDARDAGAAHAVQSNFEEFTLTNGASSGIALLLQALKGSGGCMIPVPQYPLYTATLALLEMEAVPYYLTEGGAWGMTYDGLVESIKATKKATSLVVINPGNPTGQVMSLEDMRQVVTFCYENNLTLISDEVYQENIYQADKGKVFHSFRKVVMDMEDEKVRTGVQLASFHSTSKGVIGECGRRGGFMHLMNFPGDVITELNKLQSIALCSNVDGQVMTALMATPPTGSALPQFTKEYDAVMSSYKRKAQMLATALNANPKIMTCNAAEGAMYLFPRLYLPEKYVEHAAAKGYKAESADLCWATELLEEKGIVVVPGSGFGQNKGTYHFRTTILPTETQIERCSKDIMNFHEAIHAKYA